MRVLITLDPRNPFRVRRRSTETGGTRTGKATVPDPLRWAGDRCHDPAMERRFPAVTAPEGSIEPHEVEPRVPADQRREFAAAVGPDAAVAEQPDGFVAREVGDRIGVSGVHGLGQM